MKKNSLSTQTPQARVWPRRRALSRLSLVLLTSCSLLAQAAETPAPAPEPAPAPPPFKADQRYTFKQLGAQYPLNLRGVDGSNTLNFSVRNDRVVTGARVDLRYAYSPALLADLSHINVLLNDEVAATIPVPRETAGSNLRQTIEIPPYLITAYNDLRLQLIGHYTLDCEDPLHSSLWANISNLSTLDLATAALPLPNDLANLPLPFFDRRDMRKLVLPFVFQTEPDAAMLEAAGTMSSWFGALAGYRGAEFPAAVTQLPERGNAVVFAMGNAVSGLGQTPVNGPAVAVVTHPNDPDGKLLLVMGRDGKDLKQAAAALALGSQTLAGPSAAITRLADLKPRQPYDAPRWLRTDRPVSFGDLADPKRLNVSGFSPDTIRIDVRVPPDLFGWQEKKVPIDLRYRYTPQPTSLNSSLLFSVGDEFVKSMPLFALERIEGGDKLRAEVLPDESLPMRARLDVPLELLKSRGQLQFRYMYDYIKQGECRDIIVDNVRGMIEPESTIDLTGYPHFILMPDLRAFSESGFPFTRLADLSETAVVLDERAGAEVYSAYLNVLGRMGDATGYPATGVTVARPQQLDAQAGKDLLVIAAGSSHPLLKSWAARIPGSYEAGAHFTLSDLVYRVTDWFHADPRLDRRAPRAAMSYTSEGVSAVVAGFESPLAARRSVVLLASSQPEGLAAAVAALRGGEGYDKAVQGSLAVIRGKQVDALVADQTYTLGSLPLLKRIDWSISSLLPGYTLLRLAVMALIWLAGIAVALAVLRALARRLRKKAE
ncbi:cellulose biosynthesis cyclic di-GMP-binding regulatory protein BcsB [Bordetella hinzii]|uniref:cellulose biosynthesis cyclic di-GMP-binding regulatory protein BcsB n=1 Tax=Bordetella hinzii TaxID=103855 RepID=UPI001150540B|nr:cellulose biosynthesis cyclic di-GMP-binding regulatory protein BcsB [Bordetella hinzii]QDJ34827.1 cellulose synthase regulator BcsB [Bordetella hinzii]